MNTMILPKPTGAVGPHLHRRDRRNALHGGNHHDRRRFPACCLGCCTPPGRRAFCATR